MGSYCCPNISCAQEYFKRGEACPRCGTQAQEFGFREQITLLKEKKSSKYKEQKAGEAEKEILFSDKMSDEQIREKIVQDMHNLTMHEAGTGWMRLGALLGSSTDQMLGAGFKALIDQNKIIIRQNELLLRKIEARKNKNPSKADA